MRTSEQRIERFSLRERAVHWAVALAFLYAGLTGLGLWSPRLYWLATLFGSGTTVRAWHPWGGVVFAAVFAWMFVAWRRAMRLDTEDRRWLRMAHRYVKHETEGLPEAGRFNAGQKSLFWIQAVSCLLLLLSGVVLWFPSVMPRGLRLAAVLLHPVVAVVALAGLIVHIYMGTAAVPEALRGMVRGWVTPQWARAHHPKWYRIVGRG